MDYNELGIQAIQEENYEKAAVYRDKLRMLDNPSIEEASE